MKRKRELDVDFIGGQEPLTKDEEKALSEFFRQKKDNVSKRSSNRMKLTKSKKQNV